jgi:hypothetical protein
MYPPIGSLIANIIIVTIVYNLNDPAIQVSAFFVTAWPLAAWAAGEHFAA